MLSPQLRKCARVLAGDVRCGRLSPRRAARAIARAENALEPLSAYHRCQFSELRQAVDRAIRRPPRLAAQEPAPVTVIPQSASRPRASRIRTRRSARAGPAAAAADPDPGPPKPINICARFIQAPDGSWYVIAERLEVALAMRTVGTA